MDKVITVHYTVNTRCTRTIKVDETFQTHAESSEDLFQELCEKFPDSVLSQLEEDFDSFPDVESEDFGGVDGIAIHLENGAFVKDYFPKELGITG